MSTWQLKDAGGERRDAGGREAVSATEHRAPIEGGGRERYVSQRCTINTIMSGADLPDDQAHTHTHAQSSVCPPVNLLRQSTGFATESTSGDCQTCPKKQLTTLRETRPFNLINVAHYNVGLNRGLSRALKPPTFSLEFKIRF